MAEPESIPRPDELETWYHLSEVRIDGDRIIYYGEPLIPENRLHEELWPAFQEAGYELKLAHPGDADGTALVAIPTGSVGSDGVPWTNIALFAATILSTLVVGAAGWYFVPFSEIAANPLSVLQAWPFTAAVLGVLMTHELGHYAMGRYHDVTVSLPYVIPFVFPFGTLGAIIKMKSRMPSRKALFDIGVAGPIAGLVATVVVTAIGLSLDPIEIPARLLEGADSGDSIVFNHPPLLDIIAWVLGEPTSYSDPSLNPHPVIIGGWVGMFFTFLNLLPVGQLDGGHMVRAMVGQRQETVAALVPAALFAVAGYLYYVRNLGLNDSVGLWAFWGLFSLFIAYKGPADPADETAIGLPRITLGVATFALGLLCFMLVPIRLVG
ncbi:site-2 protease family protein [Halonotius terrestris]|uniref:Site-2 protease family protein n=1 Tax=Halonotius terrestris TaxID=2487750 RepID=A0A8J8TBM4_9EURY|nr:site-2 protease family protein [Halonotius terrestris]TQQ81350.1 site-2 protease family protein [Halonotius terrestris]